MGDTHRAVVKQNSVEFIKSHGSVWHEEVAGMNITQEALTKLREFLQDYDDGFVRVAKMTTGGG